MGTKKVTGWIITGLLWWSNIGLCVQIREDQARGLAVKWLTSENRLKRLRLAKQDYSYRSIFSLVHDGEIIGYIVELDPRGFIMVSGLTELAPIKFASFDSEFADLKDHSLLQDTMYLMLLAHSRLGYASKDHSPYLRRHFQQLNHVRLDFFRTVEGEPLLTPDDSKASQGTNRPVEEINLAQIHRNQQVWQAFLMAEPPAYETTSPTPSVAPLITSRWDQGNPYNQYTPLVGGQATWTGCVATSMAQILYFWRFPVYGQGSNSYNWNGEILGAEFNHQYSWDLMVDQYNGSATPAQKDAVARLMSDAGISVNMNYGTSGSSASPNRNNSFVSFFKYSPSINRAIQTNYTGGTAWFDLMRSQVDRGWPLNLLVSGSGGGHSVVVDGYRTDTGNMVHINMGWGGAADAYYALDNIVTQWYEFTDLSSQSVIINIHPPLPRDYDGDSYADILWQNTSTGGVALWYMNGGSYKSSTFLGTVTDLSWRLVGTADFTGDGKTDIVWQNSSTNQLVVWQMNGAAYSGCQSLPSVTDTGWKVEGLGDFNSDGYTDLLWRHQLTGDLAIWLMNGSGYASSVYLGRVDDFNWEIGGVADFSGDRHPDILWGNSSTGELVLWQLNGTTYGSALILPTVPDTQWKIANTADFSGDGKADILWRHASTGLNVLWQMNGVTYVTAVMFPTVPDSNWSIR